MDNRSVFKRALNFFPAQVFRYYCSKLNKQEFKSQSFDLNERTVEYRFVFNSLEKAWPKSILDIGTGMTSLPHLLRTCGYKVSAVDNVTDYWPKGFISSSMFNRHWHIIDDDIRKPRLNEKYDFITCISTLEHIEKFDDAIDSMFNLLNSGGHLAMSFPYSEHKYVENVYKLPNSRANKATLYVCQSFSRKNLDQWMQRNKASIVSQEYWNCYTGDFWSLGNKRQVPLSVSKDEPHQLSCVLIKKS